MSVLIKGMDMPTLPALREKEGKVVYKACVVVEKGKAPKLLVNMQHSLVNTDLKAYELEEVSTPHGRLIDAEDLRRKMYRETFETDNPMMKWDSGCWIRYKMFEKAEENAPTIIEAEE